MFAANLRLICLRPGMAELSARVTLPKQKSGQIEFATRWEGSPARSLQPMTIALCAIREPPLLEYMSGGPAALCSDPTHQAQSRACPSAHQTRQKKSVATFLKVMVKILTASWL